MKIIIRYQGMSLAKKYLKPGEYTIGRSTENDISLSHKFISRRHAKIYYKDNEWWYQDLRKEHPNFKKDPIKITKDTKIDIENHVELFAEDYLNYEQTQVHFVSDYKDATSDEKTFNYRKAAVFSIIGLLFLAAAGGSIYYFNKIINRRMDANKGMDTIALVDFVKPKVVEFMKVPDPKGVRDYKKYAYVKDEDFEDEIGFCTGFMIEPGIVLTASHCINGIYLIDSDVNFKLRTYDGKFHKAKRVLGFDVKKDFLFLEVPNLKKYDYLKINPNKGKIGEKVVAIGNVHGKGIAYREGTITNITKDSNDPAFEKSRTSAPISPGSSGGPVVDRFGKVVALIFAATHTENFNPIIDSKYLLEGKKRFVDDLSPKKIKIETRNILNYQPEMLLNPLNLRGLGSWYQNAEYFRPLENIKTEIDVPSDLSTYYNALISKFSKAVFNKFEEIRIKMKEEGLAIEDWESQTTENTPIIIPYQINFGENDEKYFELKDSRSLKLIPDRIAVLSPMYPSAHKFFREIFDTEKKYKYKVRTHFLPSRTDFKFNDGSYSLIYRSGDPRFRKSGENLLYRSPEMPICQYLGVHERNSNSWDNARQASEKAVLKVLVDKDGLKCPPFNPRYLRSKIIDRLNRSMIRIKNFEEEVTESDFRDTLNRYWKVFSFPLFGNTTIDNYCIQMPQGVFCLTVPFPSNKEPLLRILRENYYKYRLSSMLISPMYWSVDALHDYYAKDLISNLPLMKDVDFKKQDDGVIIITFKTLGIEFSLPESKIPDNIRFTSGMYYNQGNKKWIGMGFDGIYSEKNKFQICGVGAELKGYNTSSVLRRIHEEEIYRKKLMHMMGKENIEENDKTPKIWRKEIKAKTIDTEITLFGYCAPFEKHEDSEKVMRIKFSSRKPFKIDYRLLEDN